MWWGGVAEPAPDASIRINMRQCLNHARDHGEFAIKKIFEALRCQGRGIDGNIICACAIWAMLVLSAPSPSSIDGFINL